MKIIEAKFDINEKVYIPAITTEGRVLSIWYTNQGIEYQVRYFMRGEHMTTYLFEDELIPYKERG